MRREYDTYHHMSAAHSYLVREEWVDRFALAGTADEVKRRVQEFVAAGIDELTIIPCGETKDAVVRTFARHVIGKFTQSSRAS